MSVMKFQEYLDHKNKLKTTPKLEKVPDYTGPFETKPPSGNKSYTPANSPAKAQKMEKGLAGEGGQELIYNPKTGDATKEVATWPKTKMQDWLEKTKGLSLKEFTSSLRKDAKLDECACQESVNAMQAIKYISEAIKTNENLRASLVREIKRNGSMSVLVAEMLQHNETYAEIVKLMENEDGEKVCRKLVKEMVAPPIHHSKKSKMDMPLPTDEMGDEELPPEESEEEMDDMEGGEEEDLEMSDEESGEEDPALDGDSEDNMEAPEEIGDDSFAPPPPKRKRRKAHQNMMNAMSDMPDMGGMGM